MRLISNLPFKLLLTCLAVIPLAAATAFGAFMSWEAFRTYSITSDAVALQKVASASGNLLLVMAGESQLSGGDQVTARAKSDEGYKNIVLAYDAAVAAGFDDALLSDFKARLDQSFGKMGEYRAAIDQGRFEPTMPLKYLQPVAAMGLEMTGRAANLVDDRPLSQAIQGFYALLQLNDAYLIINRLGQIYTKKGSLAPDEAARLHAAYNQAKVYLKAIKQFLPAPLVAKYESFWQTSETQDAQKLIESMISGRTYAPAQGDFDAWTSTMIKRGSFVSEIINSTSASLDLLATQKLSSAKSTLYFVFAVLAGAVALTILLSISILKVLSGAIHRLSHRMRALADGDKADDIPYLDRNDEIGDIAQSVEVFRQAALRNDKLEADAQEQRQRSETERAELQRQAEAEAEARLVQATSTFAASMKRLAAGDMLCEVNEVMSPQFEGLRQDFNVSVRQLRDALVSVGHSVNTVTGGSKEISDASDNLSKRTEQQAASLEETAAALEEITANVTSTSRRTNEARDVVRDARTKADHSGKVVGDAVTAMGKIENSSRQIGQIIGVIDEIAFQTNLLALNAGVEAARAGEAGKGFAVVAQEVRELAQRSANAAKEIKQLISNSELAVSEGVRLVSDTGSGLAQIAELVQSINTHMDAIATAAQEQSVGLKEVNTAVNHMDQATQQNAAMVEEMNAAGASLAQESVKLEELLSGFQLGQAASQLRNMGETMRRASTPQRAARQQSTAPRRPVAVAHGNAALAASSEWTEF